MPAERAQAKRVLVLPGEGARELVAALDARGAGAVEVEAAAPLEVDAPPTSPGAIAARLLAIEELARERFPDAVVLHRGGADALAAALVFAKLEVPLARLGAGAEDDPDGALADRLCDLLICSDAAALERLRRAGLADQARLADGGGPDGGLQVLLAWLLDSRP